MRAHVGPGTKVVDLGGRFVAPGLSDGHLHGVSGGPGIDLVRERSLDELFAVVGRAAKDAQPGAIIISNSDWHEAQLKEKRLPTARELDQFAPVNPVVLVRGGHEYVLNSAALANWDITKADAVAGRRRDRQGCRRRAQRRAGRQCAQPGDAAAAARAHDRRRARAPSARSIPTASPACACPGSFRLGEFFQTLDLVLEARKRDLLTLRFNVYLPAARAGTRVRDPAPVREILARSPLKQDEGDEWVRIGGVKLGVDGGFEGGFMTQPFVGAMGRGGTYYGINTVPAADLRRDRARCSTRTAGA